MLRLILTALIIGYVSGCATVPSHAPLVKVSKTPIGQSCRLQLAITNRYSGDIEGNYLSIAVTDKTGRILEKAEGKFSKYLFQSGYTTTVSIPIQVGCDSIAGLKVYTLAFERPDGSIFPGYNNYHLELVGF